MLLMIRFFKLAMKPYMLIAVVGLDNILVVLFVVHVRGRKAGIYILWCLLVFGILSSLHAGYVGILDRPVLIKSTAYKVSTIR
jgi:hypothetical protein